MDLIANIVKNVKAKQYNFVTYTVYNEQKIGNDFISIVMTTHDRREQTLYTLNSFTKSDYADKITVIIVDDSVNGYLTSTELSQFKFQITHITIDHNKKTWVNPCVNYNIGFEEVKTDKVIIQNAEVCHVGDVITYAYNNVNNNNYLVFDVAALPTIKANHDLYKFNNEYTAVMAFINTIKFNWYQNRVYNRKYHFLTAISRQNLEKLGGFDYDFALGSCYDDDEFIFRIQTVLKLKVCNVHHESGLLGIHQWHPQGTFSYNPRYVAINQRMIALKRRSAKN